MTHEVSDDKHAEPDSTYRLENPCKYINWFEYLVNSNVILSGFFLKHHTSPRLKLF